MIKLKLSDGRIEIFNLKSYEREKALYCAWYSMQGDPNFKDKLFRVTTDIGEKLELKLGQISECIFEESLYIRVKPSDIMSKRKK